MSVVDRLKKLDITLTTSAPPVAPGYEPAFVPYTRSGNTLYISGRLAKKDGKVWTGKLGDQLTIEDGKQAARSAAIELVAVMQEALSDLSRVRRVSRLLVMVNSTPDFLEPHTVANGASELLLAVFAEAGRHARSACSVTQLPFGACVEVEATIEIADEGRSPCAGIDPDRVSD